MSAASPVSIDEFVEAHRAGRITPAQLADTVIGRVGAHADPAVWIGAIERDTLADRAASRREGPLTGVPFAVKDNIDVDGFPTTAACPAYATTPAASAPVVARLERAGAVAVGKTNLDQFATGLVGTRSPYGTPTNPFDPALPPGGSSSGSAVAVAVGLVPFALGTDTAGSGRIPAAMNNIVGYKPTLGLLSTVGVLPACRSLDCISVFALTAHDARIVLDVVDAPDPHDPYSRHPLLRRQRPTTEPANLVIGVPTPTDLAVCDAEYLDAYGRHVDELRQLGVRVREVDMAPFFAAGRLLYEGPWLAERDVAVGAFLDTHPDDVHPVTREIILGARRYSAADAFRAQYRRRELMASADETWHRVDALVVPSLPDVPTLARLAADPIGENARLGTFSTFVNLLDLCAVAVPGGRTGAGHPAGFTLIAPGGSDHLLLTLADRYQHHADRPLGALDSSIGCLPRQPPGMLAAPTQTTVRLAVVGAHLSGQPLNDQLTTRGATLAARTTTAPGYRLYALAGTVPSKPGLVRSPGGGGAIEVEVWDLDTAAFGSFVADVPPPLAIGSVELASGETVHGFVCEPWAVDGARDITEFGGWRAYLDSSD